MIAWLRRWRKVIVGALAGAGIVLAALAAERHKNEARKWERRAEDDAELDLEDAKKRADEALARAKQHSDRAEAAIKKGRERTNNLGDQHESVAEIVDSWRKPAAGSVRDGADDEPLGVG